MSVTYTKLLRHARIIDPASGIDIVGDIGLDGENVAEIGTDLPAAKAEQVLDLTGKWVVPGVIDPHMHVSDWLGGPPGLKMMASEGVITALDMAGPVQSVLGNVADSGSGMNVASINAVAIGTTAEERERLKPADVPKEVGRLMSEGAFGIKILGGHYPLSPETTREVIRHTAENSWYVAFHAGTTASGSNLEGVREALELTDGHPLHLPHINSYCRGEIKPPLIEVSEVLEMLKDQPTVWSESYLSVLNGTSGKCHEGQILSHVTRRCCRMRGYADSQDGLGQAIRDGYANVVVLEGGQNHPVSGDAGYEYWVSQGTDTTVCFPVNVPAVQVSAACTKDSTGAFIVDALSTDGGGIPRNTMVRQGLSLVQYGALTPAEFVLKTSTHAASMMGLTGKGTLAPGSDADITVIDPVLLRAHMGISGGEIIMLDGVVLGSGGTIITSRAGEPAVKETGLRYVVVEGGKVLPKKCCQK